MATKRKVYQTIGFLNVNHQLAVGGDQKTIAFTGGQRYPKITFGQYVTEDKSVQRALEADSQFNILFKLIKVDNVLLDKGKPVMNLQEQLDASMEINANLQLKLSKMASGEEIPALKEAEALNVAYAKQVEELADAILKQKAIIAELENELEEEKPKHVTKDEEKPEFDIAKDVINMQQAREYLVKTHGQQASKLPNGITVRNKAKDLGVQFPNWKR